jgi:protein-S-isoprenylcysteine O-methyltransferase Ste14
MKITGVGPRIAIPSILYLLITIIVDRLYYPLFKITPDSSTSLIIIGVFLILIGAGLVIICAQKLVKSFNANLLMTDGPYKVCRNPLYAVYMILVFPGISLILNSWLVLSSVIVNFILLQVFIRAEYQYLEEKFGEEYKSYLNKVWIKFL